MKYIKTHLGVIIPLICLLFSLQFMFFVDNILKDYQKLMQTNYSIVLLSKKDLSQSEELKDIKAVSEINLIDPKPILDKFKDDISPQSLEKLKKSLPKFYDVKLAFFPNNAELLDIKKALEKVDGVGRVEVFSKAHDSIYNIFYLLKQIIYVFTALVVVLGTILVFKQIRIWLYEHKDRIEILDLFGAPFFFKSSILYRMAFIDSIISTFVVVWFCEIASYHQLFLTFMDQISLQTKPINLPIDALVLLGVAFVLSTVSVTLVMLKATKARH